MGTARERKLWDLELGKALCPPCPQGSRAAGQEHTDSARLSSCAQHPLDKLRIFPLPRFPFHPWMWSHDDVIHPRDAMLRSWTRADLRSRSHVILAALGSGHLATVHRIARQR